MYSSRICLLLLAYVLLCSYKCTENAYLNIDSKYYLVTESYALARNLFMLGRNNYIGLKNRSLHAMNTFLDLVNYINNEMAKELRSSIIKFYKVKYFQDFTNYVITLEEMVEIIEHCLINPVEKIEEIRAHFHSLIKNFEDVRHFETVHKCKNQLPDEVAAAHCILHQAVLYNKIHKNNKQMINSKSVHSFNETMQDNLLSIVEIKTKQHARIINDTLYEVQDCLNFLVPNFFGQLLVEAYTDKCGFLKIVNASIADLMNDRWRGTQTLMFEKKWTPVVDILKNRSTVPNEPNQALLLALFAANLTSLDIMNTCYI